MWSHRTEQIEADWLEQIFETMFFILVVYHANVMLLKWTKKKKSLRDTLWSHSSEHFQNENIFCLNQNELDVQYSYVNENLLLTMKLKHESTLLLALKKLLNHWKNLILKFVNSTIVSIEYHIYHDDFKVFNQILKIEMQQLLRCIDDESHLEQNLIIIVTTIISYEIYLETLFRAKPFYIESIDEEKQTWLYDINVKKIPWQRMIRNEFDLNKNLNFSILTIFRELDSWDDLTFETSFNA